MLNDKIFTVIVFYSLVLFIPVSALLLMVRPILWHYLLAIFMGVIVGWLDLRSDEVSTTILLLVVFGMLLGFAQPRQAWRWAILLAMWVPLGGFLSAALGLRNVAVPNPSWLASLVAFVPAFIGAYGGALVSGASRRFSPEQGGQVKN